ncbi:hypothetical protein RFI_20729 [Reticulomyxa filosa]|uniref:CYRIA/CYRIB Rac1 binding domain-containing protein n=1 Tax=Reticulomyxa filosa TaxID=46433 RepID=X6MU15_RETFI|nr:hypothetical protein RFI_20729 [Reticulomyxa filosa]|eukprot:ETO16615.1 hypothetical protein RFI_20729 [Reticulomyxa filosa]
MGALISIFNSNELKDFELLWTTQIAVPENVSEKNLCVKDIDVFEEGQALLEKCLKVKKSLEEYKGSKDVIKEAMSTKQGTDENKEATRRAMESVSLNAASCAEWYDCAVEVGNFLKDKLFPALCKRGSKVADKKEGTTKETDSKIEEKKEDTERTEISEMNILTHQALSKQICELLNFLLTFDQLKMLQSQAQNDFSFYKRTLTKCDSDGSLSDIRLPVNAEKAGFISMYLAQAIPMMKEVANIIKLDRNAEFSLEVLSTICNACVDLLKANKFGGNSYHTVILKAMVASFVLSLFCFVCRHIFLFFLSFRMYDHANAIGAFQRRSLTKASIVVSMVCTEYTQIYQNKEFATELSNTIKYSCLHVNDEQTPQSIRRMLGL